MGKFVGHTQIPTSPLTTTKQLKILIYIYSKNIKSKQQSPLKNNVASKTIKPVRIATLSQKNKKEDTTNSHYNSDNLIKLSHQKLYIVPILGKKETQQQHIL